MAQKKIKEPAVEQPAIEAGPAIEAEPVVEAEPVKADLGQIEFEIKARCINCGQNDRPLLSNGHEARCPVCGHTWVGDDEQAPFRRIQRGQMS